MLKACSQFIFKYWRSKCNRPVGVVVKDVAFGVSGVRFDSRADEVWTRCQRLATADMFLRGVVFSRRLTADMDVTACYTLRCNNSNIVIC